MKQKKEKKQNQHNRKFWFRGLCKFMKLFIKKSEFEYLGEQIQPGSILLSNHVGTSAPLALELYGPKKIRHWGAHEMNSGLIKLYKYQTKVYYHEKKHWNLFGARMFCLLASPLTNMFYKGLRLISTYKDSRFRHTIEESVESIKNGESIVIYPEDSTKGYLDELEGFHAGFVLFAKTCLAKGFDVPIYVSYYNKKQKKYIIDKPIKFSELANKYSTKEDIAKALCLRCNELGKMFENKNENKIESEDEIEKMA